MKRLECLDGLRGVLAVYVMLGHLAPFALLPGWLTHALSHGGAAVDVFFILSGMAIVQSLESHGWQPWPFLIARTARTYPVYLAMFAMAVAVQALPTDFGRLPWIGAGSPARDIWSAGWPHTWALDIAAHLSMTHGLLPDGILPGVWVSFLGSAWSLSTEWQFYLLTCLIGGWFGRRWMIVPFLALAVAGMVWQALAVPGWQFSRAFLPNKAGYFALGIASVLVRQRLDTRRYAWLLLALLALCAASGRADKLLPPLVWTLCLAAQHRPDIIGLRLLASVLRLPLAQWLGAVSYGIYLANEPVHKLLGLGLAAAVDGNAVLFTALWLPGAVLLPIAVAVVMHVWIEQPAQRWGRRIARRAARMRQPAPLSVETPDGHTAISNPFTPPSL